MIVPRAETCLKISGCACLPAGTIVPERGGRVSQLGHRGLAGVEPGHYQDSVSDRECCR